MGNNGDFFKSLLLVMATTSTMAISSMWVSYVVYRGDIAMMADARKFEYQKFLFERQILIYKDISKYHYKSSIS
jgi:hypothetical protein